MVSFKVTTYPFSQDLHSHRVQVFCFTENPLSISTGKDEMIYLQNTTESQVLFVPRNGADASGELSLKMRNTIDQDFIIDQVLDLKTSDLYFNLAISLPEGCPDGEYEYALMDDNIVLSTGILVLQSADAQTEYEKDIVYEQYRAE